MVCQLLGGKHLALEGDWLGPLRARLRTLRALRAGFLLLKLESQVIAFLSIGVEEALRAYWFLQKMGEASLHTRLQSFEEIGCKPARTLSATELSERPSFIFFAGRSNRFCRRHQDGIKTSVAAGCTAVQSVCWSSLLRAVRSACDHLGES